MIEQITSASVEQFIGEHGGDKQYARFMVTQMKINELVEAVNNLQAESLKDS